MTQPIAEALIAQSVDLKYGEHLRRIESHDNGLRLSFESSLTLQADMLIVGVGVRPETQLAKDAGLTIGSRGGIQVNDSMLTSDPHIYAVGDAIEVKDFLFGFDTIVPLAGPANRQVASQRIMRWDVQVDIGARKEPRSLDCLEK